MTSFDFAPLFRTAIGFDRLARLMDTAASSAEASGYPPYNIEKLGDESYRLTMAVAGFKPEELDLTVKDNTLLISGRPAAETQKHEVLYRGIAGRAFERRFVLADHIVVEGAEMNNGLLHVGLKRVVPEALKPRRIEVGTGSKPAIANDPSAAGESRLRVGPFQIVATPGDTASGLLHFWSPGTGAATSACGSWFPSAIPAAHPGLRKNASAAVCGCSLRTISASTGQFRHAVRRYNRAVPRSPACPAPVSQVGSVSGSGRPLPPPCRLPGSVGLLVTRQQYQNECRAPKWMTRNGPTVGRSLDRM